ncbi:D-alanyl-D-alanine carboxypeptidase [Oceanibacterium hippocampi]|uniref:D-alanyl-D-alanine carboxypeptidase DacF n=1 Tax=Oceanibacterium hippocampi TaxID=745714 RepID=A0A1Y5SLU0_9PROT|nr:D-alanyl-D-alanine carboxypeptidase [Oceanibacterium hippocampi]SLN43569.1 D-alanyl-D-alanine carboxypeptidase DacF precursor [Oceanibacterium hippocampi]
MRQLFGWGRLPRLDIATLLLSLTVAILTFAGTPAEARYAGIIIDADNGQVLYARNADQRLYPASLTKIMTLYMVFEAIERGELRFDQRLKVSARAEGQAPTKLGLKRGSTIRVEDAVLALVTKSANDAATVLAEALAPTEAAFAIAMTERARKLGMRRTSFRNATGLPNRHQRSTARDMATLAVAMLRDFPQHYHYFSQRSFTYAGRTYDNHNGLLGNYEGTDGIKTGYIRASGFNLVASVRRGERRLIGVVFGGRTPKSRDAQMKKLFDRSFAMIDIDTPVGVPLPRAKPTVRTAAVEAEPVVVASAGRPVRAAVVALHGKPAEVGPAALRAPAPLPQEKGAANWGIQLGAYQDLLNARTRLHQAVGLLPQVLHSREFMIEPTRTGNQLLYRARLGGFQVEDASQACQRLVDIGVSCWIVTPDGDITRDPLRS